MNRTSNHAGDDVVMSVRSPLGAVPGGRTFRLRAAELEHGRAAARGRSGALAAAGLFGLLTTTLVVALTAAQTDQLLPESVRPIPDWLAGPFAHTGVSIGSAFKP